MMNVVITNGFGLTANVGDHVLLPSTINLVRSVYPSSSIYVIPWQMPTQGMKERFAALTNSFDRVELVAPVIPAYGAGAAFPAASLGRKARILAWSMLVNLEGEALARFDFLGKKGSVFHLLRTADLVILRGCNIVQRGNDLRTTLMIRRVTLPLRVARHAQRPTALLNISVGPVEHPLARHMLKNELEGTGYVSVREPVTIDYLRGFARCDPVQSADTAFAFPFSQLTDVVRDPMLLGINILSRGEFQAAADSSSWQYDWVLQKLANELDQLIERVPGIRLLGVPHEMDVSEFTSDLSSLQMLRAMLKNQDRMQISDRVDSPQAVIATYARCAAAVGMRFHGYVLGGLASTPVLGIILDSQKTIGIAKSLGVSDLLIDLRRDGHLASQVAVALERITWLHLHTTQAVAQLRRLVFETFAAYAQSTNQKG